ncbi:hypothetical protein [uncultured Clostridium sp.]|uniref:hypothetical protein n=1 Tax=uncultured Clostridium sp. TaxID=59620 RepID=UPI0028E1FA47|nr:hypothetical protein [uncultured Clostridium sp.]
MKIKEFEGEENKISQVNYILDKEKFTIRWNWPKDIDIVYILKVDSFEDFSMEGIENKRFKLYTKEEYKEFNGYVETIKEVKQYKFFIFPAIEIEDDVALLKQQNGGNEIIVSTGIPNIYYNINSIKSIKSLFSKEKIIEIIINSDIELKSDVLCYVKKKDSHPLNKNDGIQFDFIHNIYPGENIMPEIVIEKDEYIKVFIKDVEKYGNLYNLKQR